MALSFEAKRQQDLDNTLLKYREWKKQQHKQRRVHRIGALAAMILHRYVPAWRSDKQGDATTIVSERPPYPANLATASKARRFHAGIMILPLRPPTDWRRRLCGIRKRKRRCRQGYEAAVPAAACEHIFSAICPSNALAQICSL